MRLKTKQQIALQRLPNLEKACEKCCAPKIACCAKWLFLLKCCARPTAQQLINALVQSAVERVYSDSWPFLRPFHNLNHPDFYSADQDENATDAPV